MKKILSILCAAAILMTMTVVAFAAELPTVDPEVAAKAEEVAGKIVDEFNDILDKAGTKTADQIVDELIEKIALKTGYSLDVEEIKALLAEQGIDLANIKVMTASQMDNFTQAIFDKIEEKYGSEAVDAVYDTIKNSDLVNWFANLYVQTPTEPDVTDPDPDDPKPTDPTPDPIPDPTPETGEGSILGVAAVLAVAAAAAVVCTKKSKED